VLWIPFTLLAAFMQALRNALQKQLSTEVSVTGVTLARFIWALPLAVGYLSALYSWQPYPVPAFTPFFLLIIIAVAVVQIIGNMLLVRLFTLRNYAIGAGLAKSEAIIAAILGVLLFNEILSPLGWLGVSLGAAAVLLLSGSSLRYFSWPVLLLGLCCGLSFALNSLWVRQASLMLPLPSLHSAAWVLTLVILVQTLLLLAFVCGREPQTLRQLWQKPGLTLVISGSSFLGSVGWFTAFSLASVAMVKTLGQIEVLIMLLISALWFKEQLQKRALSGLVLIILAAIAVILA
jgi:drug/metabolite transporter (DMT)-like permease